MDITIVEPHPDDAFLGCSSVLKQGNVTKIITVTGTEKTRQEETLKCATKYGVEEVEFLELDDGKLISNLDLLEICLHGSIPPKSVVYIPSLWENHMDHKAVAFIGLKVCQQFEINPVMYSVWGRIPYCKKRVLVSLEEKTKEFIELYPSQQEISPIIQPYEEFLECTKQNMETIHWLEWRRRSEEL